MVRKFAGIAGADRPGLGVEENAALLRRCAYLEERLFLLEAGRLPGTAIWEFKHALGRHSWEDGQHASALRARILTLRTAPRLLEQCPDPALERLCAELVCATDEVELAAGLYGVVKPALLAAYRWHLATTNPVADFPTVREVGIIAAEEAAQLAWGVEALVELAGEAAATQARSELAHWPAAQLPPLPAAGDAPAPNGARGGPAIGEPQRPQPGAAERAAAWQEHVRGLLAAAGGVLGREERAPAPAPSGRVWTLSRHPRRDPRFTIHFQFNEPGDPPAQTVPEKLVFMMRGRLNELAAAENPASVIWELAQDGGLPFAGLVELARHMWDEIRHSMLGQAVLDSLGHDIRAWPLRIGPGYSYLSLGPLARYAHLGINVEQAMMRYPPGKREEYEWCRDVARWPLAAMYQDYDWSDEVYHTQIARRWLAVALAARGEPPAGPEVLREFAARAGRELAANTAAIAALWHDERSRGRTLAEPLALPSGAGEAPAVAPEITLTADEVARDLASAE